MSVFKHIYDGIVQKRTYAYSKIRKRIRITQILEVRLSRTWSYLRLSTPLIEYVKYDQPRICRIQNYEYKQPKYDSEKPKYAHICPWISRENYTLFHSPVFHLQRYLLRLTYINLLIVRGIVIFNLKYVEFTCLNHTDWWGDSILGLALSFGFAPLFLLSRFSFFAHCEAWKEMTLKKTCSKAILHVLIHLESKSRYSN